MYRTTQDVVRERDCQTLADAVTARRGSILQQLTKLRGLPSAA
jgi:hypothetical protein